MLPKIFKPYKSIRKNLVRIGPKIDGGFVTEYPIPGLILRNLIRRNDITLKFYD